ncbi:MAG: ribosomal RNA small subunit methyltransferase A [Candidatus Heimdallarchaeota archaeon]|nr:ribosomal RNA small subunit methyltransferase A [Candidatus Heimdallarchaeota archaeon]
MRCWNSTSDLKKHVFNSLKKANIRPSRHKGQNFLINADVVNFQIDQANINQSDTVMEIGGGNGTLTLCLAKLAKKVYVIESDKRLINYLEELMSSFSNVEILFGDAVKIPFPNFNKCVSNLPYQISSPITFKLLENQFDNAILMYQREFAQRLIAKPGTKNYSRISVMLRLLASCKYLRTVKRGSLYPQPKIDSALVRIEPTKEKKVEDIKDFEIFNTVLFTLKKKLVLSVLNGFLKRKAKETTLHPPTILDSLPHAERRIFTLTLEEIIEIYSHLKKQTGEEVWQNIMYSRSTM